MSLIPDEHIRPVSGFNFAPMIDFLFLMLALFATLAVSRATLFDTKIDLAKLEKEQGKSPIYAQTELHHINLAISSAGTYEWITEVNTHPIENIESIKNELYRQYALGILPKDKAKTKVLLHIDKKAPWENIVNLIFAVKQTGFEVKPIYEPISEYQ